MSNRCIAMGVGATVGAPYWWAAIEPPGPHPLGLEAVLSSPVTALAVTVGMTLLTYWALHGVEADPTTDTEVPAR